MSAFFALAEPKSTRTSSFFKISHRRCLLQFSVNNGGIFNELVTIILPDVTADDLKTLLHFLYTGRATVSSAHSFASVREVLSIKLRQDELQIEIPAQNERIRGGNEVDDSSKDDLILNHPQRHDLALDLLADNSLEGTHKQLELSKESVGGKQKISSDVEKSLAETSISTEADVAAEMNIRKQELLLDEEGGKIGTWNEEEAIGYIKKMQCYKCGKKFGQNLDQSKNQKSNFKRHITGHFRQELTKHFGNDNNCSLCGLLLTSLEKKLAHYVSQHNILKTILPKRIYDALHNTKDLSLSEEEAFEYTKKLRCYKCGQDFEGKSSPKVCFTQHLISHISKELPGDHSFNTTELDCAICGKMFNKVWQTHNHIAWEHQKLRKFLPVAVGNAFYKMPSEGQSQDFSSTAVDMVKSVNTLYGSLNVSSLVSLSSIDVGVNKTVQTSNKNILNDASNQHIIKKLSGTDIYTNSGSQIVNIAEDGNEDNTNNSGNALEDILNMKCYKCQKQFDSKHDLQRHLQSHYKQEFVSQYGSGTQCHSCERDFSRPSAYHRHLAEFHKKLENLLPKEISNALYFPKADKPTSVKNEFVTDSDKCAVLNNTLQNTEVIQMIKKVMCFYCFQKCESKFELVNHLVRRHTRDTFFSKYGQDLKCKCSKEFSKSSHFHRHLANDHHKFRDILPKEICDELYLNSSVMHQAITKNEINVQNTDQNPDTNVAQSFSMRKLETALNNINRHQCFNCSAKFSGGRDLIRHLICHYKKEITDLCGLLNSKTCQACNTSYSKPSDFYRHLVINHEKFREILPKQVCDQLYVKSPFPLRQSPTKTKMQHRSDVPKTELQNTPAILSIPEYSEDIIQINTEQNNVTPKVQPSAKIVIEKGNEIMRTGSGVETKHNDKIQWDFPVKNLTQQIQLTEERTCFTCGKRFEANEKLGHHFSEHYTSEILEEFGKLGSSHNCPHCQKKLETIYSYLPHLADSHESLSTLLPPEIVKILYSNPKVSEDGNIARKRKAAELIDCRFKIPRADIEIISD